MMTAEVTVTGRPAGGSGSVGGMAAARPPLIRALNEQLLLGHIRRLGQCSRADLARLSGLSKPTVSLALGAVARACLFLVACQQTGRPGRSAQLYEVHPGAGFVLGLDVGAQYVRAGVADLAGTVRARGAARLHASRVRRRSGEPIP